MAWPSSRILLLRQRQFFAGGDAELPFDEIEPGDRLGHRMFDLKPRVHFDEPEGVGAQPLGAVGDEFDGAGAAIADRLGGLDRGGADLARAVPASCPAPALPRSLSDGAAAASNRARRDGSRCRGCRRKPELRYGAARRYISRSARGPSRTPTALSRTAPSSAASKSACLSTRRMPRPPPPAAGLISTG